MSKIVFSSLINEGTSKMIQLISDNTGCMAAASCTRASEREQVNGSKREPSPAPAWAPSDTSPGTHGGLTSTTNCLDFSGQKLECGMQTSASSVPGFTFRLPAQTPPLTHPLHYLVPTPSQRPGNHWFSTLAAHTGINREALRCPD